MYTSEIVRANNEKLTYKLIPPKDLPVYGNFSVDPRASIFNEPIKPKPMDKIEITKTNGKWLINGKPYYNITDKEKQFFDEFILAMKWEQEMIEHDKRLNKQ